MISTDTKTESEPEVNTQLVKLITAYCQAEKKVRSHYFPMVEKALEMFEQNLEQEEIMRQFRASFVMVNKLKLDQYEKDPEYVTFRAMTSKIVNIAKCGREWYKQQREANIGFYRMYELCRATEETEAKSSTNKKSSKTRQANPSSSDDNGAKQEADPQPERETKYEPLANRQWFANCRLIAKGEPEGFIKMITDLIDQGLLPDTILEPIKQHLSGE